MADFNNTNLADFSGVWVFCEQRQGELQPTVLELISEARKLADDMGTEVCGLLLGGKGVGEKMAKELGAYGADKVLVCESDLLETYTTDAYAKVLCDTVMAKKPEILLIAATNIGRDLGPRCAARLHTGLTADCTHLDVDVEKYAAFLQEASTLPQAQIDALNREDRNLKMTRPAFGGHLMATIICPRFRPQMATVRPGVLKKGEYNEAKANAVVVEPVAFELSEADIKTKVLEVVKEAKELVDLTGAEVVVSVGRGISKDVEGGIKLAEGARVAAFNVVPAGKVAWTYEEGENGLTSGSGAVVLTVAGDSDALPGTENGAAKVTPLEMYPTKGRATGGVRSQRFLKGQNTLILAWVGLYPLHASTSAGSPVELPKPDMRRDGSGVDLASPIAFIA